MVILGAFEMTQDDTGASNMNYAISMKSESNEKIITYNAMQASDVLTNTTYTTNQGKLTRDITQAQGFIHCFGAYTDSPYPRIQGWNGGGVLSSFFNTYSDHRIKHDVEPLNDQYTVENLNPVKYKLNAGNEEKFGLIAHEVQEYFPNIVAEEKDGAQIQSVDYIQLIPILIKEIQELKKINKKFQEKQELLEKRLNDLVLL